MIEFLSEKTQQYIKDAAQDKEIQKWILRAMFNGCARSTDIFEYFSSMHLSEDLAIKIFGSNNDEIDPETDPNYDHDCIYENPFASVLLIDAVAREISNKI